jgi:thiol-disulfide isomerase/thioredoxin
MVRISRSHWRSAAAGLVVVAVALAGCRAAAAAKVAGGGREGTAGPALTLTTLDGKSLDLGAQRGKVVIVDFWDTWCGPCLRALPHLQELSRAHPDSLVVVAVAIGQEGEAKVRSVVARQALTFPVALFSAQPDLTPAFGSIDQLPTTFLVGPDGVIRRRWIGAQSLATYENAVEGLLRP